MHGYLMLLVYTAVVIAITWLVTFSMTYDDKAHKERKESLKRVKAKTRLAIQEEEDRQNVARNLLAQYDAAQRRS